MFAVGDYIVYGMNGICRVEKVCASPFDAADTRTYYLLVPLHNPMSSTIYTPIDNERVPMRRLMTPEEVEEFLTVMPHVDVLSVPVEKQRRDIYRTTIGALRPEGYVSVMKTVERRREQLAAAHKHFPVSDIEYGRLAKHLLYSEIALVLGMEENCVEAYLAERMDA